MHEKAYARSRAREGQNVTRMHEAQMAKKERILWSSNAARRVASNGQEVFERFSRGVYGERWKAEVLIKRSVSTPRALDSRPPTTALAGSQSR